MKVLDLAKTTKMKIIYLVLWAALGLGGYYGFRGDYSVRVECFNSIIHPGKTIYFVDYTRGWLDTYEDFKIYYESTNRLNGILFHTKGEAIEFAKRFKTLELAETYNDSIEKLKKPDKEESSVVCDEPDVKMY